EMEILLESGCEITKLFEMVKLNFNKKVVNVLEEVSSNIQKGNSISKSFKKTNKFSLFFVSMVKAGEISGNLDMVMNRLYDYYDKEYKLKSKLISILTYPIFLLILAMAAALFMFISIIPNFQIIFINNGVEPPSFTRFLISMSIFIRNYYMYIISISLSISIMILYKIKTSSKVKVYIEKIQLKIPFIKNITQLVITTKFSRAFYILIKSGIEITEAIEISSQVIDNDTLYNEISNCKKHIKNGNTISQSLSLVENFPSLFITMITIGEESGSLDKTLSSITKFYEQELENKIEQGMKIIEPVIIIMVAAVIGVLIIGMLLPMFDTISTI
ncbi:MAG: type II secretion system F family protein, partial [Peptostreptococcaceae bacterium]|nr:type II secretion system F family protein [Peptostreptococcaceae bacterium]